MCKTPRSVRSCSGSSGAGIRKRQSVEAPPFCFFFIPFAICFHRPTLDLVMSTRVGSGMSLFASKLSESREELLAVHDRALAYRQLTLGSIAMGIETKFLTVDYPAGRIRANQQKLPVVRERIKPLLSGAERLGTWCGRLPIEQVTSILGLEF